MCGQLLRFPNVRNCLVSFLDQIRNNVVASLRSGGAVFDSRGGRFFLLQINRTGTVARPAWYSICTWGSFSENKAAEV